jgi:hypothetical protein
MRHRRPGFVPDTAAAVTYGALALIALNSSGHVWARRKPADCRQCGCPLRSRIQRYPQPFNAKLVSVRVGGS